MSGLWLFGVTAPAPRRLAVVRMSADSLIAWMQTMTEDSERRYHVRGLPVDARVMSIMADPERHEFRVVMESAEFPEVYDWHVPQEHTLIVGYQHGPDASTLTNTERDKTGTSAYDRATAFAASMYRSMLDSGSKAEPNGDGTLLTEWNLKQRFLDAWLSGWEDATGESHRKWLIQSRQKKEGQL